MFLLDLPSHVTWWLQTNGILRCTLFGVMSAPATCILCWHLNAKLVIGCHKLAITSQKKQIPKTIPRIQVKDWEIPAIQLSCAITSQQQLTVVWFPLSTILGWKLKIFVSRHGSVSVASAEESNLYEKWRTTQSWLNDSTKSPGVHLGHKATTILKQQFLLFSHPSCFKQFLLSLFKTPQENWKKLISTTSQCWKCENEQKNK